MDKPVYEIKLERDAAGRQTIYDGLRRKWLVLTPEEWVRQHFVKYLIEQLGYPASHIANEVALKLNSAKKRCDTLVYGKDLKPLLLVEYKEEKVEITQQVFDQIARYNSVIEAPYLVVTNGRSLFCCRFLPDGQGYEFLPSIPGYDRICGNKTNE